LWLRKNRIQQKPKPIKRKKVSQISLKDFFKKLAATYSPAIAVPSAQLGLTSVFGMGTGEPQCYIHPKYIFF
jgi:hypothetical protein